MSNLTNKYIVLIFIIIIVGVFVYNFDVYVVPKNEPLCKPVYVTKRPLNENLNISEMEAIKETFDNLDSTCDSIDLPPKSLGSFTISSVTNPHKSKVIQSVLKVLTFIPTNFCEDDIKQMVEYFGIIFQSSSDLDNFYKNVSSSTKIREYPYDSQYARLILFLIGKFDSDYLGNSNDMENVILPSPTSNVVTEYLKENPKSSLNDKNEIIPTIDFSNEFDLNHSKNKETKQIIVPSTSSSKSNVQTKQKICQGSRCSYKCNTSTDNVEGFNNLDYYAMF